MADRPPLREPERVLVIKLGALGDFVQALAGHAPDPRRPPGGRDHPADHPALRPARRAAPYVDRVETDGRPKGAGPTLRMLRRLRRARYGRIYDLQTSSRTDAYFQALRPFRRPGRGRRRLRPAPPQSRAGPDAHLERQADQLKDAGIWPDAPTAPGTAPLPDLSWLPADLEAPARGAARALRPDRARRRGAPAGEALAGLALCGARAIAAGGAGWTWAC
jgi:hypothetical protein